MKRSSRKRKKPFDDPPGYYWRCPFCKCYFIYGRRETKTEINKSKVLALKLTGYGEMLGPCNKDKCQNRRKIRLHRGKRQHEA